MILETILSTPECLPIALWFVCALGICFEIWRDRVHGSIYERTARQIEAHTAELQERERARTRTRV